MALGKSVEDSLKEAELNLRNALAFAARSEPAYVAKAISLLIADIDVLVKTDQLLDKLEQRRDGERGSWGPNVNM
jgi:hypothetical protein